jgi:hypothetical protein
MNNEEAIAVLQNELDGIPFDLDKSDFEQALEIAIKAIRNEPIDDLSEYSDKLWQKAYERGKSEARPQGEWISVSERLPEDMQPVLIWFEYYRYGDYNCMFQTYGFGYVCDDKWSPFINGETGWQDAKIIAWMPLPEPYKEAENE